MKTIYGCYYNADMTEGRGPDILDVSFENKKDAEQYIDDKPGIMGRKSEKGWSKEKYGDWNIKEIIVYSSIKEAKGIKKDKLKQQALDKLSDAEKEVLGLK